LRIRIAPLNPTTSSPEVRLEDDFTAQPLRASRAGGRPLLRPELDHASCSAAEARRLHAVATPAAPRVVRRRQKPQHRKHDDGGEGADHGGQEQ
jgi:hypothetical protein